MGIPPDEPEVSGGTIQRDVRISNGRALEEIGRTRGPRAQPTGGARPAGGPASGAARGGVASPGLGRGRSRTGGETADGGPGCPTDAPRKSSARSREGGARRPGTPRPAAGCLPEAGGERHGNRHLAQESRVATVKTGGIGARV